MSGTCASYYAWHKCIHPSCQLNPQSPTQDSKRANGAGPPPTREHLLALCGDTRFRCGPVDMRLRAQPPSVVEAAGDCGNVGALERCRGFPRQGGDP